MGEQTIWCWIKEHIGSTGFRVFLWSVSMTQDEYFNFLEGQWSQR